MINTFQCEGKLVGKKISHIWFEIFQNADKLEISASGVELVCDFLHTV